MDEFSEGRAPWEGKVLFLPCQPDCISPDPPGQNKNQIKPHDATVVAESAQATGYFPFVAAFRAA